MTTTSTEPDPQGQTPPDPDELEQQQDATTEDGDEPLGPAGVKALEAEKARRREEADRRRKATADLQAAQSEVAKLREQLAKAAGSTTEQGPDLEQLRADAAREAMAKANERIVAAELRAAATGRLTDPTDAVTFLAAQLGTVEVDGNGTVDSQQLTDMLDDLLARKPHLAVPAAAPQRFTGTANGGPRSPAEPKTLSQQIAAAEATGDYATAQRLKAAQLSEMRGS